MSDVDWSRTVFLLVGPDAIARHLAVPMLERVFEAGVTPVGYRALPMPPQGQDELYERNIRTVWDAYRFRLVDLLFSYGPMVVMLLEGPAGSHARLKELKGDSDPLEAAPGTIRRDLWAINVTMSLLHVSDSPEDAEFESSIFFGAAPPIPLTDQDELLGVCRLIAPGAAEERRFDEVLGGLRAKIAAAVWDDLVPAGREIVLRTHDDGGVVALSQPGVGRSLVEHLQGRDHPVATVLAAEFTPDHPKQDVPRLRHLLRAFGVELDRWEELVLTTSMTWRPRRTTDG
jgi:nucleoside diphosphate kinase